MRAFDRDRAPSGGTPDLRRRDAEEVDVVIQDSRHGHEPVRRLARRSGAGVGAATGRIRAAMPTAPNSSPAEALGDFDISVSAYPEKHPESPDFATDIDMLKRKGQTRDAPSPSSSSTTISTSAMSSGCAGPASIPIVPGILPVHNFRQVANFSARCGALVPAWLAERFDGLQNDPQTHALVASAVAAEQVLDLVERGVGDFHFYTMNRADLVFAICHMIGIRSHEAEVAGSAAA
jgi:methylenetetrahydrofolate reductase (NADPH)